MPAPQRRTQQSQPQAQNNPLHAAVASSLTSRKAQQQQAAQQVEANNAKIQEHEETIAEAQRLTDELVAQLSKEISDLKAQNAKLQSQPAPANPPSPTPLTEEQQLEQIKIEFGNELPNDWNKQSSEDARAALDTVRTELNKVHDNALVTKSYDELLQALPATPPAPQGSTTHDPKDEEALNKYVAHNLESFRYGSKFTRTRRVNKFLQDHTDYTPAEVRARFEQALEDEKSNVDKLGDAAKAQQEKEASKAPRPSLRQRIVDNLG